MEGNYLSRNTHNKEDSFGFEEHTWGTSWPARNYTCSFCKREFRSAQALGGHMNVHRRDRARLRSSLSSWVSAECTIPKPNPSTSTKPNPSLLSASSPSPLSEELLNCPHRSPLYSSPFLTLSSSPSVASTSGDKKPILTSSHQVPLLSPQGREIKMSKNSTRSAFEIEELKGCAVEEEEEEEEHNVLKNNEHNITLELGIGLIKQPKEKLDLELRLGHF